MILSDDPVADGQGPGVMGNAADGGKIVHRPHDIRAERETDQSGPTADQGFEALDGKLAGL